MEQARSNMCVKKVKVFFPLPFLRVLGAFSITNVCSFFSGDILLVIYIILGSMDIKINRKSTRPSRNLWWIQVLSVLPSTVQKIRRTNWFARAWRRVSFLICNNDKWQMKNMINAQDKRWVYKMNFSVPRLTTSPATMIISICSSEMKRPPTQNWLKNCDVRKIFKIASKTVTFERSLKLAQRLWLFNIPKFWNGLEWWWKIAASLLFCFLEGVYAWYFMPNWNIMYDRSYYDFCMLALILSFGILPSVSQMSLINVGEVSCPDLSCLRNIRWYHCILFPRTRAFICFSSHSLKLKSLQTKNFDQLKLCPQCPMCPLLFTMKSFARSYNQFLRHSLCKQVCWSVFGTWKRKRHICTKRKNNLTPKCAFPAHHLPHSSL